MAVAAFEISKIFRQFGPASVNRWVHLFAIWPSNAFAPAWALHRIAGAHIRDRQMT
jgi:hypothetical protein